MFELVFLLFQDDMGERPKMATAINSLANYSAAIPSANEGKNLFFIFSDFFLVIKIQIQFQKYKIFFFFRRPRRQAARKSQSGNTHGGVSTMYSKYLRSYPIYSYDLDCGHSRSSSRIFCCFCGLLCGKLQILSFLVLKWFFWKIFGLFG